jgi:hypothetical protein
MKIFAFLSAHAYYKDNHVMIVNQRRTGKQWQLELKKRDEIIKKFLLKMNKYSERG